MSDQPAPVTVQERILETLQQLLAVQTELRDEFLKVQHTTDAQITESLALQREAAVRSAIAVETQGRSARLYRRVVMVAATLVTAGIALIAYVFVVG